MFIAKPSDPNTCPLAKAFFKISCHIFQQLESFSKENTPMFKWGANANYLASSSVTPDIISTYIPSDKPSCTSLFSNSCSDISTST